MTQQCSGIADKSFILIAALPAALLARTASCLCKALKKTMMPAPSEGIAGEIATIDLPPAAALWRLAPAEAAGFPATAIAPSASLRGPAGETANRLPYREPATAGIGTLKLAAETTALRKR